MDQATWMRLFIYFCVFSIGIIVGRISMAMQYAAMGPDKNKDKQGNRPAKKS
ncbi:MAG: hypothetical protein QS98_C0003G0043 [archaeon GW2011_AR3]|nr:MAG: hypothetical protein QS98_C0003G0043 [archaeon GW2011_AR3]MBS3110085.1 hypothetical protein [Candidatus Woesearchaeota archaeon]